MAVRQIGPICADLLPISATQHHDQNEASLLSSGLARFFGAGSAGDGLWAWGGGP